MDELDFEGKKFLSSKRAAELTGYAKDYVGQLCREGRVEARLVGRAWYVSEVSIREHRFGETEHDYPEVKLEVSADEPRSLLKKEVENTWGTSLYAPEPVDIVPALNARSSVDIFSGKNTPSQHASPVHHMQSVWQDWFDTKERGDSQHEEEEVLIFKIPEEEPALVEETPVPMYRMPMSDLDRRIFNEPSEVISEVASEPAILPARTEKPRTFRSTGAREKTSLVAKAFLVALMLVTASCTFVALGYSADFFHFGGNFVVDYLSGVSK